MKYKIKAFIQPILVFISGFMLSEVLRAGMEELYARTGSPGGEVLLLPLLGAMLMVGWSIGRGATKE